jgi:hypothetical protein
MTDAAFAASTTPARKRGPSTPEGKARSSRNATRHGLRGRTFGILPGEDRAEWGRHLEELCQGYGPADASETKLVEAIAAAMWQEIRAERLLAEALAAIPALDAGRPCGGDLQEPRHALSLNTALRYVTTASMASQRAQRAFLAHRKAKRDGLLGAEPATRPKAANQNRTSESTAAAPDCTNELSGSAKSPALAALRARLDRLLDGPGPKTAQEWDLVAAIRAVKLPGSAPYHGPIDRKLLAQVLDGLGFDAAGLAWLATLRLPPAGRELTGSGQRC